MLVRMSHNMQGVWAVLLHIPHKSYAWVITATSMGPVIAGVPL